MIRLYLAKLIAGDQASVTPRGKGGRFVHAPVIDKRNVCLVVFGLIAVIEALYLIVRG